MGSDFTLDQLWDVPPDVASIILVQRPMRNCIVYQNDTDDTSAVWQTWDSFLVVAADGLRASCGALVPICHKPDSPATDFRDTMEACPEARSRRDFPTPDRPRVSMPSAVAQFYRHWRWPPASGLLFLLVAHCILATVAPAIFAEPTQPQAMSQRFTPQKGFAVQTFATPEQTGSLIAMSFDEHGDVIASVEGGPLLRFHDSPGDHVCRSVTTLCDQVNNCQGILAYRGKVYCVGNGPQGAALYRLSNDHGDGKPPRVEMLFRFASGMGEHGPHVPVVGLDGFLYVLMGNFTSLRDPPAPQSPYHHYYEGDLLLPRYEDPTGFARGIKAPGGSIVRTDADGKVCELFAGGLRNCYDMAFDPDGELFTYDNDMECDEGLPWYRPTRVNHVIAGSESGWRSGWNKWLPYFLDSLPATIDVGRGSPTGVEFYDHHRWPAEYRHAMILCDWGLGRIHVVRMNRRGASYTGEIQEVLHGRPLNVTDGEVGPDGAFWFCGGGRGTQGGIYRLVWTGPLPDPPPQPGILRAVRQDQPTRAWARHRIEQVRQELGPAWAPELVALAENPQADPQDRARALDVMQMFGPPPGPALLVSLSHAREAAIRAKAAYLMGIHHDDALQRRLIELLVDADPWVCRRACEAGVRARRPLPPEKLLPLLGSPDRFLAWAACRAIEESPWAEWLPAVLKTSQPRVFLVGATGLLVLGPDRATAAALADRCRDWAARQLSDNDCLDLLRVIELVILRGQVPGSRLTTVRDLLSRRYPAHDALVNRELVRLLAYLQDPTLLGRLTKQLDGDLPVVEKLHAAFCTQFLQAGWTPETRQRILRFYEEANRFRGGSALGGYVANIAGDFLTTIPETDQREILLHATEIPGSACNLLRKLSGDLRPDQLRMIRQLDARVTTLDTTAAGKLEAEIAMLVGRAADPPTVGWARSMFEDRPARRHWLAYGISQRVLGGVQRGEDWDLLVRAIPVIEGPSARDVLRALARFKQKSDTPEVRRQLILLGLRLGNQGGFEAVTLLERWIGQKLRTKDRTPDNSLAAAQHWFTKTYPALLPPSLPIQSAQSKWSYRQLLAVLTSARASRGNPQRGEKALEKADCIKCHRFGNRGETIGPDLTAVSRRFQTKEILESILFPSQVISDQFASKIVVTDAGLIYTGIVGDGGRDAIVLFQSDGQKVRIPRSAIEEMAPSKTSIMPEGLLNRLTLDEIIDLFALLLSPAKGN